MMVSTAIAVLPVSRSPMMSSRWPLPERNHRVDHQQSGRQAAGSPARDRRSPAPAARQARTAGFHRLAAVERRAERIDHAAQQRFADGNTRHFARAMHDAAGRNAAGSPSSTQPIVSSPRSTARPRTPPSNMSNSSSRVSGRPGQSPRRRRPVSHGRSVRAVVRGREREALPASRATRAVRQ